MSPVPVALGLLAALSLSACEPVCGDYCAGLPVDCDRAAAECATPAQAEPPSLGMQDWRDLGGDDWNTAHQAGGPPQYDDGTLNITVGSSGTAVGVVESNGTGGWEGFLIDDLPAYTGQLPVELTEDDETPMSQQDFAAEYALSGAAKVKCDGDDERCMAEDSYGYAAVPAPNLFPDTLPSDATARAVKLVSQHTATCPGGTVIDTVVGWMYRVRVVEAGQVKWTELWFVHDARPLPDRCYPVNVADVALTEIQTDANTSPPAPRTFVTELKETSCGGSAPEWCGYCATNTCEYVRVDLDWWRRK